MGWWRLAAIGVTFAGCSTRSPEATAAPTRDAGAIVFDDFEAQRVTLPWGGLYVTSKLDVRGRVEQVAFVFPTETATPEPAAVAANPSSGFFRVASDLPEAVARQTIFGSVAFDYAPNGVAPVGVYDAPLWDVHTSLRKEADVQAIDCSDQRFVPEGILPAGYSVAGNCVPTMGMHAFDVNAPELNKQRFTLSQALTYYGGVYNGHVLLVAHSFLGTRPNGTYAVPVARIPERPGILTPTTLDVRSDATRGTITFTYDNFIPAPL